jgi:hypothetical protein
MQMNTFFNTLRIFMNLDVWCMIPKKESWTIILEDFQIGV